eukprot:scaffold36101_cov46-Attheya_sp.AAC.1
MLSIDHTCHSTDPQQHIVAGRGGRSGGKYGHSIDIHVSNCLGYTAILVDCRDHSDLSDRHTPTLFESY